MTTTFRRSPLPPLSYLKRYQLADAPFAPTASPRYAYARSSHIQAVNAMRNVVIGRTALGICSGDVGLGKTTIARMLAEDLRANDIPTVFLPAVPGGPRQSDAAIMRTVLDEFKLKRSRANSTASHYSTIGNFARDNDDAGATTVVIFDDAQELRTGGTRAILQLIALQTTETQLVQVILFGQNPELLAAVTGNPALHSRLSAHVELTPFAESEVAAMIAWRLRVAERTEPLFTPEAIHSLTVTSRGIPRKICRTAHNACIYAADRDSDWVEDTDVERAAAELLHSNDGAL